MKKLKKKFDKRNIGIVIGVLLPILTFIIFWQLNLGDKDLQGILHFLSISSDARGNLLMISILPDLLLFYFVNFRWKWQRFTTGLVGVTVLITVFIIIMTLL